MRVRDFRLVSGAHQSQLRELFQTVLAEWAEAWGADAHELQVAVEEAAHAVRPDGREQPWRQQWSGDCGAAWCDWNTTAVAEVAGLVFPADGSYVPMPGAGRLAAAGAEAAFDALLKAVQQRAVDGPCAVTLLRAPGPDSAGTGSGAMLVVISLRRARLRLLLDGTCVGALLGPRPTVPLPRLGKVALQSVLRQTPVPLAVTAGEVEIGAGTLLGLGVGDVIALPVALDRGFTITLAGGPPLCSGFIGRSGDQFAVEIAK